jgi:hypothetical protein
LSSNSIKSLTKQINTLKKLVSALQAHQEDSNDNSNLSSEDEDALFLYACVAIEATNTKVAMALKFHEARDLDHMSVWLLDNLSTLDLCCNPDFSGKRCNAKRSVNMLSNKGGLQISKECTVPAHDFWVWFTTRAMTNTICLKNLIHLYQMTNDSKQQTALIVHHKEFGLPIMIFDMHPCGLHICYPKKTDGHYGFVQTVADNMPFFTKRQIEGALKARDLYKTLRNPSNANFEAVLQVSGIGGCTITVDNAKIAYKI